MPKKIKKQNISVNTGEPIEEKELDLNPVAVVPAEDGGTEEDGDDELDLSEDELDPYADKWEQ